MRMHSFSKYSQKERKILWVIQRVISEHGVYTMDIKSPHTPIKLAGFCEKSSEHPAFVWVNYSFVDILVCVMIYTIVFYTITL